MNKLLCVGTIVLVAMCVLVSGAHAQHRGCGSVGGCHAGVGYGSVGYSTFASPFVVSTPFISTVAVPVAVPAVVSAVPSTIAAAVPVAASYPVAVAAPVVSTFPLVSTPLLSTTGYCSGFASTPFVFGSTRNFHRHR